MILEDTTLAYNYDEHFYYLTIAGLSEYTGYDELAGIEKNLDKKLIKMGRALHQKLTSSGYNGRPARYRTKDIVEYLIFQNTNGERQAIINALVSMIEYDYDTDWFRDVYSGAKWPEFILEPLRTVELYNKGNVEFAVPVDEYLVGY